MNWETGKDIYTLLCIKKIANKNLMYNKGNSTQSSVVTKYGKIFVKTWIHVYVQPIHFVVQQKLTQHCKETVLQ